ncbi:hypothetical protein JAAARDRAFT_155325 [Jaapia argillacea MUCL 33604]|uniref:asparagine--tRNA ligase n=1 Tax=Jaapia argillacea MUCL 33604 TaxID=933084 RepID=A0A067PV72_9AGAM|nr:hypothetical protein JAAARDRAFT_155325 [Jaapia argillacea MUCL 33604]
MSLILRRFASTSILPPTIRQLLSPSHVVPPTPIEVNGWVKSIRRQKNVSFAVITDGSERKGLQTVFVHANESESGNLSLAKRLTNGACVRLSGQLCDSPGKGQVRELRVEAGDVLGECDPEEYPIQKQSLPVEYLRDKCHLRARTDHGAAMLRLRDRLAGQLHGFFKDQGFISTNTPILTSNDCEGAGETFRISSLSSPIPDPRLSEFFTQPSYLTVSSQLHLEALATSLSRVYTLSPCFRAEPSQTSRHLAEFWMLEAEWAFVDNVEGLCAFVEGSMKDILRSSFGPGADGGEDVEVLWKGGDEARRGALEEAGKEDKKWERMSYDEAIKELSKHNEQTSGRSFQFKPEWGKGLQSEHEKWLAEHLVKGPVFVTDYPASLKPFYMRSNSSSCSPHGPTVACFDLLVPHIGELAGGSLREERLTHLTAAIEKHGLKKEDYEWYLELRKFGGAPHGGFGLGFERLISWVGAIENVRECIAMPRWAGRMLL